MASVVDENAEMSYYWHIKNAGIDKYARVISNGLPIAGTVYELLLDEARQVFCLIRYGG